MQRPSQTPGWYVSRKGGQYGPYTWDGLVAHARKGLVGANDKVFSPESQAWTKVSAVPGLLGANGKPLRSRAWLGWSAGTLATIAVAAAVVLFAPITWPWETTAEADLGASSYTPPSSIPVLTDEWGPTPPDRICILLAEDASRADAETVADALGAKIVGEVELIGMYTLETDGATESDLRSSLDVAAAQPGVEAAFPEQLAAPATTREGWRCTDGDKLEDKVYSGDNAIPYTMIGAQQAWDLIRANGSGLKPVQVGITDDGLYQSGEFDSGGVTFQTPDAEDSLAKPGVDASGTPKPYYSHGTAVASVLAADDDDGKLVGVGTVLGGKLNVTMTNIFGSRYGGDYETTADPNDPSVYTDATGTWAAAGVVALMEQVKSGSTIINCSWGSNLDVAPPEANVVKAYRRFFEKMQKERPDVLFVCAAGNYSTAPGPDGYFPGGIASPNVMTVGNVDNDGKIGATQTNTATKDFEVTLAAPGDGVPHGVAPDGTVVASWGGTSMATPQVAAVAAMLRSLDPDLDAADIKDIIKETARTEWQGNKIEAGVGGRVLAADQAVLWVLNLKRAENGQDPLTMEQALGGSLIALVATHEEPPVDQPDTPGAWRITATVSDVGASGVGLVARYTGADTVEGDLSVSLAKAGSAEWVVRGNGAGVFHVKRGDSEACWRVQLGAAMPGDPAGGPAQAGDPASGPDATGGQQAGEFPAAPVGITAVMNAVEAAADDVGLSVGDWLSPKPGDVQNPDVTAYFATLAPYAHVSIAEYRSPPPAGDPTRDYSATAEDVPWSFHELPAYQCDMWWNEAPTPTFQIRWWVQGNFRIKVQYPDPTAAGFNELPEALWRRFGGGTGTGTPTGPPPNAVYWKNYYDQQNSGDELPFGSKADVQTGN